MVRGQSVATEGFQLSDSTFKDRPHFKTSLMSDANGGLDDTEINLEEWRKRLLKMPKVRGRFDFDSFQLSDHAKAKAFQTWNDEGEYRCHITSDYRSQVPHRDGHDDNFDPTNGFVSVAGEVDRQTGSLRIPTMVQLPDKPHALTPQAIHSNCKGLPGPALRETCRSNEKEEETMMWGERADSLAALRARLGGWTSDADPRAKVMMKLLGSTSDPDGASAASRDRRAAALKYMYTSQTQQLYEDVSWDVMLPRKQWAPIRTLEEKPDVVTSRREWSRYEKSAADWQNLGGSWDRFQSRNPHYHQKPVHFGSAARRSRHIPNYTGCIGSTTLDALDNLNGVADAEFQTLTAVRTKQPKPTDVAWRPFIPNYGGKSHWLNVNLIHSRGEPMQTTLRDFRPLPLPPQSEFKQSGILSRLVTTVPPFNPFNKSERYAANTADSASSAVAITSHPGSPLVAH